MPFKDVIGQERVIVQLQRALGKKRLAQAYLFVGPEGVGKRTTALALAQAVNCQQEGAQDGCGLCPSCRKIQRHLHPDVRVIAPEGASLRIAQIRELGADVALKPYEGRWKVFILDAADRMTEEGGNALLKTLEEPAGQTLLVLVTSNVSALLPTVISRCQEVRFSPIPPGPLAAYLAKETGMDPREARLLARLSGGSLGLALQMAVGGLLEARDRVVDATFAAIREGEAAILDLAEAWAKDRDGLEETLASLQGYVRDLLAFKLTGRKDLLMNQDREGEIGRRAALLPQEVLRSIFAALVETRDGIARNLNSKLALEVMLVRVREAALPWLGGRLDG